MIEKDVETPLERINSNTVPQTARMQDGRDRHDGHEDEIHAAPIEAHTASGPTMMVEAEHPRPERQSALVLKRLRRDSTLR